MKMCKVMKVSRSGYYFWLYRNPSKRKLENEIILEAIKEVHKESMEIYGSPTISFVLKRKGISCSRPRVARLMKFNSIRSKIKKKYKVTTNSKHTHEILPNILSTASNAKTLNEQWVADISYIRTDEGWLYLSAIMDLYSRKIISWLTSTSLSKEIVTRAIWLAIKTRSRKAGVKTIFHSDRGVQYASKTTKNMLKQNNFIQSMSGKGSCYDNACMESFFHTLKVQEVYHHRYKTREEATARLFRYIELFYNRKKPHSSLNYLTPEEVEKMEQQKELKKAI